MNVAELELIDKVIDQIVKDVSNGDVTSIEEMLRQIDTKILMAYIPEGV